MQPSRSKQAPNANGETNGACSSPPEGRAAPSPPEGREAGSEMGRNPSKVKQNKIK